MKNILLVPEVAGIGSCESVNIQTEVSHSQIEHKEVTGSPHLLHCEERHNADGIEEESKHAWKWQGNEGVQLIFSSILSLIQHTFESGHTQHFVIAWIEI